MRIEESPVIKKVILTMVGVPFFIYFANISFVSLLYSFSIHEKVKGCPLFAFKEALTANDHRDTAGKIIFKN